MTTTARPLAQTCTKIPSLKASILRKCAPLGTATGGDLKKSWKFAFDNYDITTKCDKQISLRGVEICYNTRPSNQPSLYEIAIPDKVWERNYFYLHILNFNTSLLQEGKKWYFLADMQLIHEVHNVCQKVICALKPRSDERARDIFGDTVCRKRQTLSKSCGTASGFTLVWSYCESYHSNILSCLLSW